MTENSTPANPFERPRKMHRFTARNITVAAISTPAEPYVRLTFAGPDLHDFVSEGPGDHARLFFPNPATGELIAPTPVGSEESGIVRPEAPMFPRDFTPLNIRTDESGARTFDADFLLHPDPGPASAWAGAAKVGDAIVVVGPRGSVSAPQGADRVLLVVDPSALPAATRWIEAVPASTAIEVIVDVSPADLEWAEAYLRDQGGRDDITVTEVQGSLADALSDAGVDEGTYVFAAGEASRLVPLRRLLKYELEVPRAQYQIAGYWKRGMANFDHHAPIDPEDPED